MAGIGIKLNKIFEKNTLATHILGFGYSVVVTIAPMLVVILNILLMGWFLGFNKVGYTDRELFPVRCCISLSLRCLQPPPSMRYCQGICRM